MALVLMMAAVSLPPVPTDLNCDALRVIPVQHNGRYCPLDTLARDTVAKITGRQRFEGHDPVALFLSWQFAAGWTAGDWMDAPIIKVEHAPLKREVGLDESRRRFSRNELMETKPLQMLFAEVGRKQRDGNELSAIEKQAADIFARVDELQAMLNGQGLFMVPHAADGHQHDDWVHPADGQAGNKKVAAAWASLGSAFRADQRQPLADASQSLLTALDELQRPDIPTAQKLAREVQYNQLRPFRYAWVFMVLAMVAGLAGLAAKRKWVDLIAMFVFAAGFLLHSYGIMLRWQIAGRAPFANMYESLIVMAWGIGIFALVFFAVTRMRLIIVAAGALGAVGLILADLLPLESSIGPIPPVLRNTAWLTIHVVTIMLAYGALALAMGVGHVQLAAATFVSCDKPTINQIAKLLHGIILVGVLFLTAGIIFGSIWANASWGRYWGWDPKETWSLITLFGYLGMLHARYVGWLRHFGMAVLSIATFTLVVMTYYGVNYVLGVGLHSYGFGAGGLQWVLLYVGLEALLLLVAAVWHHAKTVSPGETQSTGQVSAVLDTK